MIESQLRLRPEDFTDQELLGRMLERDAKAWREFYRRFDRLIYRCIHKVTSRFRHTVGPDDVQEIYGQLMVNLTAHDMRRLRAFQPEKGNKLGSWIGLLATNTAWDYLRSVARQPMCSEIGEAELVSSQAPSPLDEFAQKEQWQILGRMIQGLSAKDRTFVRLYFVDGLSAEEVADEMSISIKTVYSKKHKIRCRLEQELLAEATTALN
ncbi:MAG: sigma-70 family RNA polymerase sigma factor [Myxococcales bacterium]|jgi:RNA polymerase sigma-70 factor (ECF subfamily)|nr:sigma-70 family RNA polymerase sigma factor [Myxococcales bacterium]